MSATLEVTSYVKYFKGFFKQNGYATASIARVFVGTKLYPVEEVFLDDIKALNNDVHDSIIRLCKQFEPAMTSKGHPDKLPFPKIQENQSQVIVGLIQSIVSNGITNYEGQCTCILVFLPGKNEILELSWALEALPCFSKIQLFILHSEMEIEEQQSLMTLKHYQISQSNILKIYH